MSEPRAVLNVERISFAALHAHARHERREIGDQSHTDPTKTHLNSSMGLDRCPEKAVRRYIEATGAKIDPRNTTPVTRLLLSASPTYFRPGREDQAGAYDIEPMKAWATASVRWLRKEFGEDLVHVALHRDETTVHLHAVVVPTYERTTKRGTKRQVSHHQHPAFSGQFSYQGLQDRYGEAVADLGILRGERAPDDVRRQRLTKRQWLSKAVVGLMEEKKRVSIALALAEQATKAVGLLKQARALNRERKELNWQKPDRAR